MSSLRRGVHPEVIASEKPAYKIGDAVKVVGLSTKFHGFNGKIIRHSEGRYQVNLDGWDARKCFPKLPSPDHPTAVWFNEVELEKR